MKILITGGLGYIGGRLANHLNNSYGSGSIRLFARKKDRTETPSWADDFDIVRGDVLDEDSLSAACNDVDAVVHLAALNEIVSAAEPKTALRVNGEGTFNTLKAAVENGVNRFIYFSTYHVYGLNAKGVIDEDAVPQPIHPYAISHHVAEDFVRMFNQKNEIKCVALRLSNGFGYPADPLVDRWSLVFNNLCLQAAINNKIILKSSGKQHRDFVTLEDVSRAVEHLLKTDTEKIKHLTYNLGGEKSLSILEVAEIVAELSKEALGRAPAISAMKEKEQTKETPIQYKIDRFKDLGFKLTSNINEEVIETLKLCDKHKEVLKCYL